MQLELFVIGECVWLVENFLHGIYFMEFEEVHMERLRN